MKKAFTEIRFRSESRRVLDHALDVIQRYEAEGYKLSLRQLYYQLVAANVVENTERSYKRVGELLVNARYAGLASWDMIEDRGRSTITPPHWSTPRDILDTAAEAYRIDKWTAQPHHVEVMVEKAALEGVLQPVCHSLDVPFTSNRGYSSASAMFEAAQRLESHFRARMTRIGGMPLRFRNVRTLRYVNDYLLPECGKYLHLEQDSNGQPLLRWTSEGLAEAHLPRIVVLYLGDHDPSGIDMARDVHERLALLSDRIPLEVHRIALNMDQIRALKPPENPAKMTDARAASYVRRFGASSWELDAVPPEDLARIVTDAVVALRDPAIWAAECDRENAERSHLSDFVDTFDVA